MLDYFGSIEISAKDVDKEIIRYFRNKVSKVHLTKIISELREQKMIENNYSVSGWNIFGRPSVVLTIENILDSKLTLNNKKLKLVYSIIKGELTRDMDVIQRLCFFMEN